MQRGRGQGYRALSGGRWQPKWDLKSHSAVRLLWELVRDTGNIIDFSDLASRVFPILDKPRSALAPSNLSGLSVHGKFTIIDSTYRNSQILVLAEPALPLPLPRTGWFGHTSTFERWLGQVEEVKAKFVNSLYLPDFLTTNALNNKVTYWNSQKTNFLSRFQFAGS